VAARTAAGVTIAGACLAAAAGACGGVQAADLFLLTRTGPAPGERLTLLVDEEGGASCNGGPKHRISDSQLVQARAAQEELKDSAAKGLRLPARPGSVTGYSVREESGTVTFADNSAAKTHVMSQLSLLVTELAMGVCGLPQ
jgi:hypothetical protein